MISEEVSSVSAKRVHIAVYVTNHGFGHVNRLMAVLNHIAPEMRVTVRADKEIWPAIEERLDRPVEFGYFPSDLGTVSPPGQNSQTDWPATFERLANRYREIQAACQEEVGWLKSACITSVYADASPIPIRLAHEAGLTGYLGANFTWDEIYADLLATAPEGLFTPDQTAQYQAIVDDMKSACEQATLLRFWPYTQMSAKVREVVVDMELRNCRGIDSQNINPTSFSSAFTRPASLYQADSSSSIPMNIAERTCSDPAMPPLPKQAMGPWLKPWLWARL